MSSFSRLPQAPFRLFSLILAAALLPKLHAQQPVLAAALPEAPSALLFSSSEASEAPTLAPPQAVTPYATRAMVNGRPYFQPTGHQQLKAYEHDLILGPRPYIHAAIRATIEQIKTIPVGWGQDFPGFLQRYGSAFGEAGIDTSVRYGLGYVLHEDVRYIICHHCSVGAKFANAALYEVTARHGADGHRAFSLTPIIASVSGPMVAYAAWYPPGYDPQMAIRHVPFGIVTRFVFDSIREFVFDRDTPAEKAAKKASTATP